MCGLFGWSLSQGGVIRLLDVQAPVILASANDTRGGQSWGWLDVYGDRVTKGLKRICRRSQVKAMEKCGSVMAHTRLATRGEVTPANSHPFSYGHVTGAHNGMIYNADDKYTVDSEHLINLISKGKPSDHLRGYGVVTWVDSRKPKGRIYLCKLTQSGEISVANIKSKNGKILGAVYSSEKSALEQALTGLRYDIMDVEAGRVHYLDKTGFYITKQERSLGSYGDFNSWRYGMNQPFDFGHPTPPFRDAPYEKSGVTLGSLTSDSASDDSESKRFMHPLFDELRACGMSHQEILEMPEEDWKFAEKEFMTLGESKSTDPINLFHKEADSAKSHG